MGDDEPVLVTRASGGRDVKGRPQALLSALQKRRDEAAARLRREREKLENQAFLRGASPDAVARARANRQDLEQEIASLENQLAHLSPQ